MDDMQQMIDALTAFWTKAGCVHLSSYERPVPTGLMHPEIFFALLDGEPCRYTWLQPVRRPLDSRGGEHPVRLNRHHQFQVVLRGDLPDVRASLSESFAALGIRLGEHEVRFADWPWESHSLDASGNGWHLRINGLSVGRVTWIDRLADQRQEEPAVEISYGVERLLLLTSGARHVDELSWKQGGPSYGALRRRSESELERYANSVAEPQRLRKMLDAREEEAQRSLQEGLPWMAYELALGALLEIDLLETRGSLTLREREQHLERVRAIVVTAAHITRARRAAESLAEEPAEVSAAESTAASTAESGDDTEGGSQSVSQESTESPQEREAKDEQ